MFAGMTLAILFAASKASGGKNLCGEKCSEPGECGDKCGLCLGPDGNRTCDHRCAVQDSISCYIAMMEELQLTKDVQA
jgi:hypothetical protein